MCNLLMTDYSSLQFVRQYDQTPFLFLNINFVATMQHFCVNMSQKTTKSYFLSNGKHDYVNECKYLTCILLFQRYIIFITIIQHALGTNLTMWKRLNFIDTLHQNHYTTIHILPVKISIIISNTILIIMMTIELRQVTSRMAENTLLSVRFIPVTKYVIIHHKFYTFINYRHDFSY